jgi:isoamylase
MSPSTRPEPVPGHLSRDLPPPPGVTLVEGGAEVAVYAGHAEGV